MSPFPEPTQSTPHHPGDHQLQQQQDDTIQEFLTILMRGKWVILTVFGLVVLGTAFFTFRAKPVYEATAMVLIDMKSKEGGMQTLDIIGTATANKITNELETLKSRSMAETVVRLLFERKTVDGAGEQPIAIIHKQRDGELLPALADMPEILARLKTSVDFSPIRDSDIIKVTAQSHSPAEAALIANMYTAAYTDRNINTSRLHSRAVREFLQTQLEAKHRALDTTETALQTYMRSSGMVDMDTDTKKMVDQISQLEATRDAIDVDIKTRTRTLNSYKQELTQLEPSVAAAIGESNDAYIRLLQEQLAQLEVQRDVAVAQNPGVVTDNIYSGRLKEIDGQISTLRRNLQERTNSFLTKLIPGNIGGASGEPGTASFLAGLKQKIIEEKIALDGLSAREQALNNVLADYERRFSQIPHKVIELAKHQRARLSTEKLYLLVEEKFNEAAITETSEFGYVNVMDPAAVPMEPVSPSVMKNLLMAAGLGLFLGIGLVLVRAQVDDRIKTPEDLKKHSAKLLSTVGVMEWEKRTNGKATNGHSPEAARLDQHLVAFFNPLSSVAEGYRHLRTSIQHSQQDFPLQTVMVTSPTPKEGKTTTVCNLAVSFAQGESRVLLVDADMRRPMVHTLFGCKKEAGLADVLLGRKSFEESVHRKVMENLDLLCSGTATSHSAEILNSHRMRQLIDEVKASYDIVLFDSPPLLALTDAAILSRSVDGVLVVAWAGRSNLASLNRAEEILSSVGKSVLGVVLNNFNQRKAYGGYYGRHKREYYSYGYGYTAEGNRRASREKT